MKLQFQIRDKLAKKAIKKFYHKTCEWIGKKYPKVNKHKTPDDIYREEVAGEVRDG